MKKIIARGTALFLTIFMTLTFSCSICYATGTETEDFDFTFENKIENSIISVRKGDEPYTLFIENKVSKDLQDVEIVLILNDYAHKLEPLTLSGPGIIKINLSEYFSKDILRNQTVKIETSINTQVVFLDVSIWISAIYFLLVLLFAIIACFIHHPSFNYNKCMDYLLRFGMVLAVLNLISILVLIL